MTDKTFLSFQCVNLILYDGLPFSHIRSPRLKRLVKGLNPSRKVIAYPALKKKIVDKFLGMKARIKMELGDVDYVCLTTDAWSEGKKAFVGVTGHFLGPNLARKTYALACRRVKGSQDHRVLAFLLQSIMDEFNLVSKVSGIVTDNGANFCKAFRVFGERVVEPPQGRQEDQDEEEEEVGPEREFTLTGPLLDNIRDDDSEDLEDLVQLPPHHRCAAHTLNLVATKDIEKAIEAGFHPESGQFKRVSRSAMATLTKLWNIQSRSTKVADRVRERCGRYLPVPNTTR